MHPYTENLTVLMQAWREFWVKNKMSTNEELICKGWLILDSEKSRK